MNIQYLLRSLVCVSLSFCIVFSSSYSALASTTTEQAIKFTSPRYIVSLDDDVTISSYFSIGDYNLDSFPSSSSTVSTVFPVNVRVDANNSLYFNYAQLNMSSLSPYDNCIRVVYNFSSANGDALFDNILGISLDVHGLFNRLSYNDNSINESTFDLNKDYLRKATYRLGAEDGTRIESGNLNLNDFYNLPSTIGFKFDYPPTDSTSFKAVYDFKLELYFDLPKNVDSTFSRIVLRTGMYTSDAYIYGADLLSGSSGSSGEDDYNKNVEAELGNIQTGIDNVINSVVQMGNQAWQGAQQTVQAVTQMTQQLNTAIDQQRQDILEGLGLLGDDIDSSMTNVKTEIINIGSSITNKLESTTESITNKIESTTETITDTIENKVDEVTSAVDDVKDSVVEVKDSIIDLPNKLKDMLTGFFVPNEQTINSKYSEFETLLSDRFGLIYQSADIIHDFADSFQTQAIMTADTGGIITMPQVTVSLAGTPFTFGGYEVDIIPDGFETLQQMCRLAVSMVCTVVFINMLKEKLEWILR